MATTRGGGGGGSASRVGDGDVDLGEGWDWRSIPRLVSSACLFLCSGGCFGCCDKAVKQLGELSKNLITHDQIPIPEPFWSTTTIEVEPSDLRANSSFSISTWGFDQHGTGSSHNLPELGNYGRFLWEQTRQEWTEIRSLRPKVKQVREPVLSACATSLAKTGTATASFCCCSTKGFLCLSEFLHLCCQRLKAARDLEQPK